MVCLLIGMRLKYTPSGMYETIQKMVQFEMKCRITNACLAMYRAFLLAGLGRNTSQAALLKGIPVS